MRSALLICASLAVLLALGLLSGSCDRGSALQTQKPASGKAAGFSSRPALEGGDARAWLTPRGNAGDSGYCAAQLKLPLAQTPAWSYKYSAAQFSEFAPASIVHYNGLLLIGAECPQVLGLDVKSGQKIFQRDVYAHQNLKQEKLVNLFIHPQGLLTAGDDRGRVYCWDIEQLAAASPAQRPVPPLWLSAERVMLYAGCVAFGDSLVTYGSGNVTTLAIADGKQQWQYPDLLPLSLVDGIVESQDGVIVRWSLAGDVVALNGADGALLWKLSLVSRPFRVVTDDARARVYIPTSDESLQCRDLHSGVLKWSYSWRDLVSDADRQRLAREHGLERVVVWPADIMVGPNGVWLALASGDVLSMAADGKPVWHVRLPTPLFGGLAFANGLLLGEVYLGEDMLRHPRFGPLMGPFNPAPPDWAIVRNASASELKSGMFFRFAVLDLRDGHQLDSFEVGAEPDILPSPTPAGEMIVFGYRDAPGTGRSVILSYNWLQGGTG